MNSNNFWVAWISIHSETMVCRILADMSWYTTKTKHWEASIIVIWLKNITNWEKSLFILVVLTHVVERIGVCRIAVWSCIINSTYDWDLPTRSKIVRQWRSHEAPEIVNYTWWILLAIKDRFSWFKLIYRSGDWIDQLLLFVPSRESNTLIFVVIAQSLQRKSHHWQSKIRAFLLDFTRSINFSEFICAWNFSSYLETDLFPFSTYSDEPWCEIIKILPTDLKGRMNIWSLNSLRPHNNSTTTTFTIFQ